MIHQSWFFLLAPVSYVLILHWLSACLCHCSAVFWLGCLASPAFMAFQFILLKASGFLFWLMLPIRKHIRIKWKYPSLLKSFTVVPVNALSWILHNKVVVSIYISQQFTRELLQYVCTFWHMLEQLSEFNSRSISSVKHDWSSMRRCKTWYQGSTLFYLP